MNDILIKNGSILTMAHENDILNPGWLYIRGSTIKRIGRGEPDPSVASDSATIIDATGMIVIPGLINCHTHLCQTLMRSCVWNRGLSDWLDFIRPIRLNMSPEDTWLSVAVSAVENLRSGVTSVVHHHKVTSSSEHFYAAIEAAKTVGLRTIMILGFGGNDRAGGGSWNEIESRLIDLLDYSHDYRDCMSIGLGPTDIWRCPADILEQAAELARCYNIPLHMHASETAIEVAKCIEKTNLRPIEMLESIGVLSGSAHLVHCVYVSDNEIELIAENGAKVVHCPVSNMYLASGIAPIRAMLDKKITIALGTDGIASNNTQNMFETIKVASLLAKVKSGEADRLGPYDALKMATVSAATLLGRPDVGKIAPDSKADVTIANLNTARCTPHYDLASTLAYSVCASDIHTVIVNGRILLDSQQVASVNEPALLNSCLKASEALYRRSFGNMRASTGIRSEPPTALRAS